MGKGKILFFTLIIIFFIPTKGVTADIITPSSDDVYINNDTVINVSASPYNINDSNGNGVVIINSSDIILDCNGSVFNGSLISGGKGINVSGFTNVTVKNCLMMTYESDIFLNDSSSVFSLNNTYSNTSFGDLFSNVTRQWYVTVNVTNFTYSPLENATVSLNDSSNNLLWTENTTSSGLTSSHIVSQYFLNSSGYLNYTPHDIIVSKNGFIEKIRSEAIDESMSIFFRLGANKTISSCQTMDEEGATYFLNVNITDSSPGDPCMVIEASNVTLDCMNNNITGSSDWGMYVNNADNVTIQYCNIYNFTATGILFENSSFGLIEYNDVSNSTFGHGIQMGTGSHNNSICFNNASHNELTAYIAIENTSYYNVFHDNFASYCNDMGFEAEHGAHHNYFHNNTILDTEIGVKLSPGSHNNTIRDNFINNTGGVNIDNSSDNLIENNVISYSNSTGVTFQDNSSRNRIHNNDISVFTTFGISLCGEGITGNNITDNTIENGDPGIFLCNDTGTTISGNSFSVTYMEIQMNGFSVNTTVFNNIFKGESMLIMGTLTWDNGLTGNRWTTYDQPSEGCEDANSNGICDSSYAINENNTDYLPIALVVGTVTENSPGGTSSGSPGVLPATDHDTEGCNSDTDCNETEGCLDNNCTQVECACGYVENHSCVEYECCGYEECEEGMICDNHTCVSNPENESVSREEAEDYIEQVEEAINNMSETEYYLAEARILLEKAKKELEEGNYAEAKQIADMVFDSVKTRTENFNIILPLTMIIITTIIILTVIFFFIKRRNKK